MEKIFDKGVVVISGGLGDIGKSIALEFAKHGASVALCDIVDKASHEHFFSVLSSFNVPYSYHIVDVTDHVAVSSWLTQVEQSMGTPTLVIANAAIVTKQAIQHITPEQWNRELNINLNGSFYLAQNCAARLLSAGLPGNIVFIGSWAAHAVHAHIPAYSVSKAALRMLCKCMALEFAKHHIRVNEIAPGYVEAGLTAASWKNNPDVKKIVESKVPVGLLISAEEVARQVMLICHPDNRHMTGSTLLMDGGLSLL